MSVSKPTFVFLMALAGALAVRSATAAEIVHSDGRRETVKAPHQDAKGQWLAEREGRVTILRPGDVVVVIDDAGAETVTIPPLVETPDPPQTAALLAALKDSKNDAWRQACEELGRHPSKSTLDALVALTSDKKKDVRLRAVNALALLRTRESVIAAATAVLGEKDTATRRQGADALFQVQEIFRRCDVAELVKKGLADKDVGVRLDFAQMSPRDVEEAAAVLRADGIKHSDHHIRESSALELGERGDASGESILIGMLARTRMPGVEDDEALSDRLVIAEQTDICRIFGKLRTEAGKAALQKATKSKFEAVRKAAAEALKLFEEK